MRKAKASRSSSQTRLLLNILENYCIDSVSRIVSLLRRSCLSVFTMKRVATDNKSTTCCMQMLEKYPIPLHTHDSPCCLCSRFTNALNVDCVSCTRAARVGTLPRTFRLPPQCVFRYTRAHRPEVFRTMCLSVPQSLSRFPEVSRVSERGLDRDYVAELEPRAQEEEQARALPLRGHERREGGERKKKTSVVTVSPRCRQGETRRRSTDL